MSRSRVPAIAALLFAVLSVPLSGCDLHDKAWDAPGASAPQGPTVTPGSPPPVGTGEIVITVGANGGVACSLDGVAVPPLSPDAIVRSDTGAGSAHLLIVDNSARDTEVCFPTSVDLDALDVSGSGRNAIRHLGHSLISFLHRFHRLKTSENQFKPLFSVSQSV